MKLDVLNTANKKEDVQISEATFGKDFNAVSYTHLTLPTN